MILRIKVRTEKEKNNSVYSYSHTRATYCSGSLETQSVCQSLDLCSWSRSFYWNCLDHVYCIPCHVITKELSPWLSWSASELFQLTRFGEVSTYSYFRLIIFQCSNTLEMPFIIAPFSPRPEATFSLGRCWEQGSGFNLLGWFQSLHFAGCRRPCRVTLAFSNGWFQFLFFPLFQTKVCLSHHEW